MVNKLEYYRTVHIEPSTGQRVTGPWIKGRNIAERVQQNANDNPRGIIYYLEKRR